MAAFPMHANASRANTENPIVRGALPGYSDECLTYPHNTATCRALAVNSMVGNAFAVNTVSTHGNALNTGIVGLTLPIHANARVTNTKNPIVRSALAGHSNERLTYPDDTATCGALAVNSMVRRALAMNTMPSHGDALNSEAVAAADSIHANARVALTAYAICGCTASVNPSRGLAGTPNANASWGIAENSNTRTHIRGCTYALDRWYRRYRGFRTEGIAWHSKFSFKLNSTKSDFLTHRSGRSSQINPAKTSSTKKVDQPPSQRLSPMGQYLIPDRKRTG
jgi:hypothetical protein